MYIFYENIDGISSHKIPDLLTSSSTADYHIIIFTETWLDQTVKNEILHDQYTVHRKDRYMTAISQNATQGGGVLIAVRANIKCEIYTNDLMTDLRSAFVFQQHQATFIYIVYTFNQRRALKSIVVTSKQLDN